MQRPERSSVKNTCISSKTPWEINTALCKDIVKTVLNHTLIWESTRALSYMQIIIAIVLLLLSLSRFWTTILCETSFISKKRHCQDWVETLDLGSKTCRALSLVLTSFTSSNFLFSSFPLFHPWLTILGLHTRWEL